MRYKITFPEIEMLIEADSEQQAQLCAFKELHERAIALDSELVECMTVECLVAEAANG